MELHGKKVLLRAVEESDCEMLRQLTNDPEFERLVGGWSFPVSTAAQREWFAACRNSAACLRYTIVTEEDGAVGMIGLKDIDWKNGVASGLGMRIARKEIRTHGLATDAWMTLLRYAFTELRLNRVNGAALSYNAASLRVCEKVGFKVEGVQRQAIFKGGAYQDLVLLGVLKSDYEQLVAANHYWD